MTGNGSVQVAVCHIIQNRAAGHTQFHEVKSSRCSQLKIKLILFTEVTTKFVHGFLFFFDIHVKLKHTATGSHSTRYN